MDEKVKFCVAIEPYFHLVGTKTIWFHNVTEQQADYIIQRAEDDGIGIGRKERTDG